MEANYGEETIWGGKTDVMLATEEEGRHVKDVEALGRTDQDSIPVG